MLEKELKKIYRFFVLQERELYLQINTRLHIRAKYETFSMVQIEKELDELHILNSSEQVGSAKMLKAAAFTYVASVLSTLLQIFRLLIMALANRRNN